MAGQLGLEPTPDEYVAHMVDVFREVWRVLRADGTLWLNIGDSYAGARGGEQGASGQMADRSVAKQRCRVRLGAVPGSGGQLHGARNRDGCGKVTGLKPKDLVGIPWRLAFALQADGWWLRSDVIWHKPNPMPESVTDRPTKAHEYVFLMSKSERYYYDAEACREPFVNGVEGATQWGSNERTRNRGGRRDGLTTGTGTGWTPTSCGRNARSVWTIATEPYSGAHFATMPSALVSRCILAGCPAGGVVLDPFLGSGTVGMVAESLGRRWLGIELQPDYEPLIRERTAQLGLVVP